MDCSNYPKMCNQMRTCSDCMKIEIMKDVDRLSIACRRFFLDRHKAYKNTDPYRLNMLRLASCAALLFEDQFKTAAKKALAYYVESEFSSEGKKLMLDILQCAELRAQEEKEYLEIVQ